MADQHLLDVRLTERIPSLLQVAAVAPEHCNLTNRQVGNQHQLVQAIGLNLATHECAECPLHFAVLPIGKLCGGRVGWGRQAHPDVVQIDRSDIADEDCRVLVDSMQAEVAEQRHQIRNRCRHTAPEDPESPLVCWTVGGARQRRLQEIRRAGVVDRCLDEPGDLHHVTHRSSRADTRLVRPRDSLTHDLEHVATLRVAKRLDQRRPRALRPRRCFLIDLLTEAVEVEPFGRRHGHRDTRQRT